jgi:hypothetical protein
LTSSAGKQKVTRPPTPAISEDLARWLLAYEAGAKPNTEELAAAGERVYHRLREHLAVLLGANGFDALWMRTIHLAQPKFRAEDDTAMAESFTTRASHAYGLYAAVRGHDWAVIQQNLVVAFASFITLLFTFIGEELGFRFIRQIWPDLPPDTAELPVEGPHNECISKNIVAAAPDWYTRLR